MNRLQRLSLRGRLILAFLVGLALCTAALVISLAVSYERQVNGLAQDRLKEDQALVRAQLEELRLLGIRVSALVAEDPGVVAALEQRDSGTLDRVIGRLREQAVPAAQILAVLDAKRQLVAVDPFADVALANDAPVKAALGGARDGNVATSRNSQFVVRSGFPQLAIESAWPVWSGDRPIGAVVALNPISDETLNVLLRSAQLQAAIILPQQRTLLAGTPELRRASTQKRLPGFFFDPSQKAALFVVQPVDGSEPFYFVSQPLASSPSTIHLLVGVSAAEIKAAAASSLQRMAIVAGVAVVGMALLAYLVLQLLLKPLRTLQSEAQTLVKQTGVQLEPAMGPKDVTLVAGTLRQLAGTLAEARQAQRRDRGRVEAIIDSMAEGVVVSDANRRVTYVNPIAKRLLGIHGVQPGQRLTSELIPASAAGQDTIELSGAASVIETRSGPIIGDDGQTTGYVTVLRDASQAAELDRLKSDFVGVVSHELRTPLTSIKGSVDLLLEDETGELNATQRRFLSTIRRSSDRLINLVNDLLDLSQLEAGRVQLDRHPVDVRHLVEDTVASISNLCAAKKQSLRTAAAADLPPVFADRQRMEQVLVNLLGNAIKYTPEQGEISVCAHQEAQRVVIEVSDTGPGLRPEEVERIFQKFYRAGDGLTQQQPGSGLGLAIARSLVDLHGGQVWVRASSGQGATFFVSLPIYEEEE